MPGTRLNYKSAFQEGNFGLLWGSQQGLSVSRAVGGGPGELANQGQFPWRARMMHCNVQEADEQTGHS